MASVMNEIWHITHQHGGASLLRFDAGRVVEPGDGFMFGWTPEMVRDFCGKLGWRIWIEP
jgi:hypothetical protein